MHLFQRIHPLQLYTLAHLVACTVTTAVKVVAGDLVRKYDVHVALLLALLGSIVAAAAWGSALVLQQHHYSYWALPAVHTETLPPSGP